MGLGSRKCKLFITNVGVHRDRHGWLSRGGLIFNVDLQDGILAGISIECAILSLAVRRGFNFDQAVGLFR